jgi:ankyrin repeat protein
MDLLCHHRVKRIALVVSLAGLGAASVGVSAVRADVRRTDFRIDADLAEAAQAGDSARVRSLLDKGAKVDARDPQTTWTPLMWAARGGHVAAIRVLVGRGAQVNARSLGDARSYFSLAQSTRPQPSTSASSAGAAGSAAPEASTFRTANSGVTPLLLASAGGWNIAASELLKKGAQVNARTSSGETALEAAAFRGYLPLVDTLLKRGANPNARNGRRETPLIVAIKEGHSPVVKRLLAAGADAQAQTSDGYSALVLAKYFGFKDIERLLQRAASRPTPRRGLSQTSSKSALGKARASAPKSGERKSGAPAATGPDIKILN